jgi:DNA-binding MarR family transcriptional regulator
VRPSRGDGAKLWPPAVPQPRRQTRGTERTLSERDRAGVDPIELAHANWVDRGWVDAADGMALVTSIMRVQQVLLARVEGELRPYGLTFARFEVLRLLAFARTGELPVGKIGERLQVHPASVTNAVQRLESDGLVERRSNPSDGRSVLARITDEGRDLVERCTARLNEQVFAIVPGEREDHRRAFAALREIRRGFGDFG